jgi:hypothetical protein
MTKKKTIQEIKSDFIKVHGERYNYDKFNYINYHTKGIIICKEHGDFEQNAANHLQGKGCRKCSTLSTHKLQIKSTITFINDAILKHNELYDYSKVNYNGNKSKIIIICKIHGDFEQLPSNHLKGYGCPTCGKQSMTKLQTKSTIQFIDEANKIHFGKYDYSNINYINAKTKIKIICNIHGEFEQEPNSHLQGNGCKLCGIINCSKKRIKTTEEYINEIKKVHGIKYNYTNTVYEGSDKDIQYECEKHGIIIQNAQNHLSGRGCHKCVGRGKNSEDIIYDAINIHGNLYDYSNLNYIDGITKFEVICKKHGSFYTNIGNHIIKKTGCPKCSKNYSTAQIQWLNFIQLKDNIKIQHAENIGEFKISNTLFKADGYCLETNTIYEFHGDYYHGNPNIYNSSQINKTTKCTHGELYKKTLEREQQIKVMGFNLVTIWESDWIKLNKCVKILQKKYKNFKLN